MKESKLTIIRSLFNMLNDLSDWGRNNDVLNEVDNPEDEALWQALADMHRDIAPVFSLEKAVCEEVATVDKYYAKQYWGRVNQKRDQSLTNTVCHRLRKHTEKYVNAFINDCLPGEVPEMVVSYNAVSNKDAMKFLKAACEMFALEAPKEWKKSGVIKDNEACTELTKRVKTELPREVEYKTDLSDPDNSPIDVLEVMPIIKVSYTRKGFPTKTCVIHEEVSTYLSVSCSLKG